MRGLDSLGVTDMYKCNDCGAMFDEPATYRECVGEFWGTPAFEEFGSCPVCESEDYEEVE